MDPRFFKDTPTDNNLDVVMDEEPRRALRRAVELRCELVSHYSDDPEVHVASDVSPYGMWIDTFMPLHPGAEVVLGFRPPRYEGPEMLVFATVTRVVTGRRRGDRGRRGMAVEFNDMSAADRELMATCLLGIAPRLDRERWLS
jgi:hypothetical protein